MTDRDLLNKLHDEPFQPVRAPLSNNTMIDVLDPNTVVVGPSSAIMPMESVIADHGYYVVTRWRTPPRGGLGVFLRGTSFALRA